MRKIADFHDSTMARALGDYLLAQGISNQVDEEEGDSVWSVWVHDDDLLDRAREQVSFFRSNPTHPDIRRSVQQANDIRAEKERETRQSRAEQVDVRTDWHKSAMRAGGMTKALMGVCIAVWVIDNFLPHGQDFTRYLYISNVNAVSPLGSWLWAVIQGKISIGQVFTGNYWLPEVLHGQVWRLVTPVFMHAPLKSGFSILHLVFNMGWLAFLGLMIERKQGPWRLLLKVLAIAVISNLAQYIVNGMTSTMVAPSPYPGMSVVYVPNFLGMSGVVYGLFGYIWIRTRYVPGEDMYVDRNTVIMFIVWFFLCMIGVFGPIANTAHGAGLLVGALWGYISAGRLKYLFRRMRKG